MNLTLWTVVLSERFALIAIALVIAAFLFA